MSFEASALVLCWVAIVLLALVVSGLVRQVHALSTGRVRVQPADLGLRAGSAAPELGRLVPGGRGPALLLFLNQGCGACDEALGHLDALAAGDALHGVAVRAVFPTAGTEPARRHLARWGADGDLDVALLEREAALFERYKVAVTPFGVAVDEAGLVLRSEPIDSGDSLRRLLQVMGAGALPAPAR